MKNFEIFSDFDETISTHDMFDVLAHALGKDIRPSEASAALSVRERREEQARILTCTLDEADALLARDLEIDPTFAAFARFCRAQRFSLTILSTGIAELERRILQRASVGWIRVEANDAAPSPRGWRVVFRDAAPEGLDKASYVRARSEEGRTTVMIGDGRSDFAAARVADVCFAKRDSALERYLAAEGISYSSFRRFDEIAQVLARG